DPLELQSFFFSALVKTHARSRRMVHDGYRCATLRHRDLLAEVRHHSFGLAKVLSLSTKTSATAVFQAGTEIYRQPTQCGINSERLTDNMGSSPSCRRLADFSSGSLHGQETPQGIMHYWMDIVHLSQHSIAILRDALPRLAENLEFAQVSSSG